MYESSYDVGLRILDISDPTKPKEVGYLDTVVGGGSWSNYPYFRQKDVIAFTSMQEGLFVVRFRPAAAVP